MKLLHMRVRENYLPLARQVPTNRPRNRNRALAIFQVQYNPGCRKKSTSTYSQTFLPCTCQSLLFCSVLRCPIRCCLASDRYIFDCWKILIKFWNKKKNSERKILTDKWFHFYARTWELELLRPNRSELYSRQIFSISVFETSDRHR